MKRQIRCILTGGSCTGKTTLAKALEQKGFHLVPEASTVLKKNRLLTASEPLRDYKNPSHHLAVTKVLDELIAAIPCESPCVVFDRSFADQIAYCRYYGVKPPDLLVKRSKEQNVDFIFRTAFLLNDQGNILHKNNMWRKGSRERALKIHTLVKEVYEESEHMVIDVPNAPVNDRLAFVMRKIGAISV